MKTRRARALVLAGLLAGCGFHPLYAPGGAAVKGLPEIYVDVIPNRDGQLMRQALQAQLGSDSGDQKYELSIALSIQAQGIGIQQDNSSTRTRFIGTAHWTLHKPGPFGTKVAGGVARTLDGSNVIDEQFFYSDLSSESVTRRIADLLAARVTQEIAVFFRSHPDAV